MSDSVSRPERPWRLLVGAVVIVILIIFAFAFWSEREDARTLPPEQLEGVEEGFGGSV